MNHRTRIAAERRRRMRAKLVEASFVIFGERGVEASVIDEITSLAGVSRGTFYNYFKTNEDALREVAIQAGEELMAAVAPVVEASRDAAERVAAGARSWLMLVERHPALAKLFRRAGHYLLEQDTRIRRDPVRDLVMGVESGRFSIPDLELGFFVTAGPVLAAINRIAVEPVTPGYAEALAERILIALGVERDEARRIANLPISGAMLPPDSLAVRAEAMAALRSG